MRFITNFLLALAFAGLALTVASCCSSDGDVLNPIVHNEGGGGTT